jgi:hypothetical protein
VMTSLVPIVFQAIAPFTAAASKAAIATQKAVRLPPDRETGVVIVDVDFSSGATTSSAGQGGRESSIPNKSSSFSTALNFRSSVSAAEIQSG